MTEKIKSLEPSSIGYIRMMSGQILGHAVVFYLFSWKFDDIAPWIYFAVYIALSALNILLLTKLAPELVNERGKNKSDIKRADRIIIPFMLAFTYFLPPMTAGLDYRFSAYISPNPVFISIGILLVFMSFALETWAMLINRHFEKNIRIQKDREQQVITAGPYKFIRHPGYLSYILRLIAFPFALCSPISAIPAALGIVIHIIRTAAEDRALIRELDGYMEYAKKTKYRLVPFVW